MPNIIEESKGNISDIITDNINITKSYGVTIDGTYNALVDINGYIRARGRSEMLIIKGDKVYLSKSKHGLSEKYGIPGGGWDPNEDHAITAARESEEESRIKTKNVEYASSYLLIYDDIPGWVKKKVPEEYQWKAYYTEVYVGEYNGKYTGKIDDEDKDDIIKTGKFYNIKDIFDDLYPIHQAAIMNYLSSAKNESNILSQENSVFSEAQNTSSRKGGIRYIDYRSEEANKYIESNLFLRTTYSNRSDKYNGEIAVHGDEVAGYIFIGDKTDKGFINSLYVDKKYRKQGIASRLLKDAIHKYGGYDLTVSKSNKVAIGMYTKRGFVEDSSRTKGSMVYMKLDSKVHESAILESSKCPDEVPDDIIDLLKRLNSYDYGYIKDGKKVNGMENFFNDYRSLTISEFERYKIGVCWDYVHYEANWFKKHGYKCDTFYVQVQDEAGDCPSHTYLVFYLSDSDKVYYFESSWGKYSGIEAFDNISQLHSTIKDRHIQYYNTKSKCDPSSYFIEKFNAESTSWEHLKCGEYMVKVSKGRIKLESTILEESRSEIPTKEFGVPGKRKFPLTDAKHVKSAIKFFNYVDEEDEAELARNIKRKAKEFGVVIRCGKQNRLSKYISKEYVNEFMAVSAIGNCMYAVNNGNIKQHIAQGDHIVSATDSYPFTKKEKKKKKDPVDGRISMYMGDGEKLTVNESSSSKVPIYIIAFDYSSIFANTLKMATHSHFNHISIALSPDLNKAYTFARSVKGDNSKKGFTIEPLSQMIKEHGDFLIKVNAVYVNKNQYKEIKECIEYYVKHKDDTSYNYGNLIKAAFKVGIDNDDLDDDSMNCSIFVDYILKKSGVDITDNPNSNLVFPEHLANADNNHDNVITVYYGKASGYDKKKIERINLESSIIEEAKTIKVCKKCGSSNIGVIIKGEPVYICKDCEAYNGVVPFKEGASDDTFFDDIMKQFDDLDMEPIPTDIFHERKDQP